jgi:hypothetical protein
MMSSTNHEAHHYAVFAILLLLAPNYGPNSSSAPYARTLQPVFFISALSGMGVKRGLSLEVKNTG